MTPQNATLDSTRTLSWFVLSTSFSSVSIFSVYWYSRVSISMIFTGEGTTVHSTWAAIIQNTEVKRIEQRPWMASCHAYVEERGEDLRFVLWLKLKMFAVCMVSAEMLNCKLLSTQAAGIKYLYFTWCDGNYPWPTNHGITLASTLCSGEEPNAIIRYLNFCYRSIKND